MINEAQMIAPLFHGTALPTLLSILESGILRTNSVMETPKGEIKGVSLTRDWRFARDFASGAYLVLDQEKLKRDKRVAPTDYWHRKNDGRYVATLYPRRRTDSIGTNYAEAEEFVIGDVDLSKYIISVNCQEAKLDFYAKQFPGIQEQIDALRAHPLFNRWQPVRGLRDYIEPMVHATEPKITEDRQGFFTTPKFWYRPKTNEVVEVPAGKTHHAKLVREQPQLFGLTRDQVMVVSDGPVDYDEGVLNFMVDNRWVRGVVVGSKVSLEAGDMVDAKKTLIWIISQGFLPTEVMIDHRINSRHVTHQSLIDPEDIDFFVKHGRVRRKFVEGRDAPLYHSSTVENALDIMTVGYIRPSKEGNISLTRDPNLWYGADGVGFGFVQFVIDQRKLSHRNRLQPVDYFGNTDFETRPTGKSEAEERLTGHRSIPIRDYVTEIQIRDDVMELVSAWEDIGEDLGETLAAIKKIAAVYNIPVVTARRRFPALESVVVANYRELLQAIETAAAHGADDLMWTIPGVGSGILEREELDECVRAAIPNVVPNLVDEAAERGRLVKLVGKAHPTVAPDAIRESVATLTRDQVLSWLGSYGAVSKGRLVEDHQTTVVHDIKTLFARYIGTDDVTEHFKSARQIKMPGMFGTSETGGSMIVRPIRFVMLVSQAVVDFLHKYTDQIEQQGWVITSIEGKAGMFEVTLDARPSNDQLGLLYIPVPASQLDATLQNGIVPEGVRPSQVLLGRTPAAARLIALRKVSKSVWTDKEIAIIEVNAKKFNLMFYAHPDFGNCVYTYTAIPSSALRHSKKNTLSL